MLTSMEYAKSSLLQSESTFVSIRCLQNKQLLITGSDKPTPEDYLAPYADDLKTALLREKIEEGGYAVDDQEELQLEDFDLFDEMDPHDHQVYEMNYEEIQSLSRQDDSLGIFMANLKKRNRKLRLFKLIWESAILSSFFAWYFTRSE